MDTAIVFSGPIAEADMVKLYLDGHGVSARLDDESVGTWAPHYVLSPTLFDPSILR